MRSPASRQSRYALDCLNFVVASVQAGMGTFVAFYLTGLGWSKESVGLALGTGQIAGVVGQIPGGAVTDAITWKRGLAAVGILMSMGAAFDSRNGAAIRACLCRANPRWPNGGNRATGHCSDQPRPRWPTCHVFADRAKLSLRRRGCRTHSDCPRPSRQLFGKKCNLLCNCGVVCSRSCGALLHQT